MAVEEFKFIGMNVLRPDARDKVRGKTVFTTDLKFPNMLHARLVRSPFAHARILSIDIISANLTEALGRMVFH
jgi:xanthine dehydrogenase molybdenum-binding subunit